MPKIYYDEFHWDPGMNEDHVPPLKPDAPEFAAQSCPEIAAPAPEHRLPPEYEQSTAARRTAEDKTAQKRREILKKLFAVPAAASVAVVSIVLAAFGVDPLGGSATPGASATSSTPSSVVSPTGKTEVPLPTLSGEVTYRYHAVYQPTGETYYNSALTDDAALSDLKTWVTKQGGDPATMIRYQCDVTPTGKKPSKGAIYVGDIDDMENLYFLSGSLVDTYTVDVYYEAYAKGASADAFAFPTLPNLDPDFAGKYAWSGLGTEEYLVVAKSSTDYAYLVAGSYYTDNGVTAQNVSGASYDKSTNTLTLTDYHGSFIDANLMGNGFKIKLVGDNSLDAVQIWGAMYGGSVTFTGSGTLTINKSGASATGLLLNCEESASCLMIDSGVTLDIYGDNALVISASTMETSLYVHPSTETQGGTFGVIESYDAQTTDATVYDASVLDGGNPSTHVTFKPAS